MKAFQVKKTKFYLLIKLKLFGVLLHVYVCKRSRSKEVSGDINSDGISENDGNQKAQC